MIDSIGKKHYNECGDKAPANLEKAIMHRVERNDMIEPTLREFISIWLGTKKLEVKPATYNRL